MSLQSLKENVTGNNINNNIKILIEQSVGSIWKSYSQNALFMALRFSGREIST